jgi:hypothetical protein
VSRFAHAIVNGRYPNVYQAVPDCRRELARVTPGLQRTDAAVVTKLLNRAYAFGRPQWMHYWTDQEKRLLERHASALAHGKCPDVTTAARLVKRAFKQAGLGARHPDGQIRDWVIARAQALGRAPYPVPFRPEEDRIISRFSQALARNEYSCGKEAVSDCRRAYARARMTRHRSDATLITRINTGARALGWTQQSAPLNASGVRIIDRFARALVSGRYPSIEAASRECRAALKHAGQGDNLTELGLRRKLRVWVTGMRKFGFEPPPGTARVR